MAISGKRYATRQIRQKPIDRHAQSSPDDSRPFDFCSCRRVREGDTNAVDKDVSAVSTGVSDIRIDAENDPILKLVVVPSVYAAEQPSVPGAAIGVGGQMVLAPGRYYPFILPISDKNWKSTTAGMTWTFRDLS
jgi:hypothetical protein